MALQGSQTNHIVVCCPPAMISCGVSAGSYLHVNNHLHLLCGGILVDDRQPLFYFTFFFSSVWPETPAVTCKDDIFSLPVYQTIKFGEKLHQVPHKNVMTILHYF